MFYRIYIEDGFKKDRGNILLTESILYEKLYLKSETEFDINTYFRMMRIYKELAAYDLGFRNIDHMETYLDDARKKHIL